MMAGRTISRVIYVTSVDASQPNGPGVNEREFVLALHQHFGARMLAIVPRPGRDLDDFSPVNVRYLAARRDLARPIQFVRAERELERAVIMEAEGNQYDLLITRQRSLPFGFQRASRRLRIPFVMRHMTSRVSGHELTDGAMKTAALRAMGPLDRAIWRDLGARALSIDTPTAQYADQIAERLDVDRDKIFVKDNTVNTARFRPGRRAEARAKLGLERFGRIVGYAGGYAHQRGGEQMFLSAKKVLARFPDTGFVIVGGGSGMEELKGRIRSAGLEHAFVTPGVVPFEAVPDYISAFDVGVALDAFEREQSLGNAHQKIRQYVATGVPVVTGSNSPMTEHNLAVMAPSNDIAAFEAGVLGWLEMSDEVRARFRERAHRYAVENLSTAASLARQIEFWEARLARLPAQASN